MNAILSLVAALALSVSAAGRVQSVSARGYRLDSSKPVVAVMDVHGTLIAPTWRQEYGAAVKELMPGRDAAAWVEQNAPNTAPEEVVRRLAQSAGISEDEARAVVERIRAERKDNNETQAMPGALDAVRDLAERKVPIVVLSGGDRVTIMKQLRKAGFLKYIPEELILGDDQIKDIQAADGLTPRDRAVYDAAAHFPGFEPVHFNDWTTGFEGGRRAGALTVGLPQGEGREGDINGGVLASAGADVLMTSGWSAWPQLRSGLKLSKAVQEAGLERRVPMADGEARELTALFPSERPNQLGFRVEVSDDLSVLSYSKVVDDTLARRLGVKPTAGALALKPLARVASDNLITPIRRIRAQLAGRLKDVMELLIAAQKRYTEFRGIAASWDASVDFRMWTTNIDSIHIHREIEDAGLIARIKPARASEIGVGGGHISAFLADRAKGLKELNITDISLYALRTAARTVLAYLQPGVSLRAHWGKGLKSLPANQDLIVVNPPYIPNWPDDPGIDDDPYRGTGLIRELVREAAGKLNRSNPEASLIIGMSSMTEADFRAYLAASPQKWTVEKIGRSIEAPLKIGAISEGWAQWLVSQGGLRKLDDPGPELEPYWHTLNVYRLRPL